MKQKPLLYAAIETYFDAKTHLFRYAPEAKILDVGPLRCLHKHPGWPEVDGFYAVDVEPQEVIIAIKNYKPHPKHMLTVMTSTPEDIHDAYAKLGYQRGDGQGQPFMRKSLVDLEPDTRKYPVRQVETPSDLKFINSDRERMNPAHLSDRYFRYYYIELDYKPVCWGRTVATSNNALYIAGMDTLPEYRRRGLATSLMNRMHADGPGMGAEQSILCASPIGYPLYSKLGYEVLANMHSFLPQNTTP